MTNSIVIRNKNISKIVEIIFADPRVIAAAVIVIPARTEPKKMKIIIKDIVLNSLRSCILDPANIIS